MLEIYTNNNRCGRIVYRKTPAWRSGPLNWQAVRKVFVGETPGGSQMTGGGKCFGWTRGAGIQGSFGDKDCLGLRVGISVCGYGPI
ncbi:hypothetical protein EEL41_00545 [Muribaculaceae bacterium Isolate-084 (Janvier)]|nr:hypothetical protein EEL37_00545 [Muribaculaceae bacterium Isolate-077 (Janvier)]ROT02749.1 hypothetical protein EEL41_00545 [Muribaculaceae bacterium Isolate-084 (Janvier)]